LGEYVTGVTRLGIWQRIAHPLQDKIQEILEGGDLSEGEREIDVCAY